MNIDPLIAHDKAWSQALVKRIDGRFWHTAAWILARTGDSWLWFLIIVILIWQKRPLGWSLLWAVAGTAVIVAISKAIFKRGRPSGPGRAISSDKYSFPSGHAARAGAIAITMSFYTPRYTLLWLLWAVVVSLARVALARHYLTDIVGGLTVGILFGLVLQIWI